VTLEDCMNVPVRPIVVASAPVVQPVVQPVPPAQVVIVEIPMPHETVTVTPAPKPAPVKHAAHRKPVDPCYATIQECVVIGHRQTTDNKGEK
jgi:hypothetical protein